MYYNSNKSNNDYYKAYKREISDLAAYKKAEEREKIIKLILSFLALALFILSAFYLYKYFNPILDVKNSFLKNEKKTSQTKILTNIVIKEEELSLSIPLSDSNIETTKNNINDRIRQKKQKVVTAMHEKDNAYYHSSKR